MGLLRYMFVQEPTGVMVEVIASNEPIARSSLKDAIKGMKFTFPEGKWVFIGSDTLEDFNAEG